MPKSVILPAKQHLAFQRTGFSGIHDFGDVDGLFKVPTCVLIKDDKASMTDIPITYWTGNLGRGDRNVPLTIAGAKLRTTKASWSPMVSRSLRSPYYPSVLQGSSLVPRSLWFVEPPSGQPVNLKAPFVRTAKAERIGAKKPWRRIDLKGKVEAKFLFGTALAEDLLPFAIRKLRLVVLPLLLRQDRLILLSPDDILAEGGPLTSDWVATAERIWEKRRSDKEQTLYDRLNYDSLLTSQSPTQRFVVLYNRSATNLTAAYVAANEFEKIGSLPIQGFVTDFVMYRYYADSEEHALYLTGILNSRVVNEAIKPWQTQGLKGERDIARRPFEVCPIPLFDPKNSLHRQILLVARSARQKMCNWTSMIEGNAAQARRAAKVVVRPELDKLDGLVAQLLHTPNPPQDATRPTSSEMGSLFGPK